ncbi:hypothetical protein G7Z17_g12852 [Cylindrodendrum hubeiense]|uniref:Uncharacterized protein n=1 Tax=Cylindrodendrum hubeiense TaxID=595255 RepID=A0A9P5H142_9HYPO|nr:hypothetical protein G7Z17_g12852 [Cylindrodendrum hubeiense]
MSHSENILPFLPPAQQPQQPQQPNHPVSNHVPISFAYVHPGVNPNFTTQTPDPPPRTHLSVSHSSEPGPASDSDSATDSDSEEMAEYDLDEELEEELLLASRRLNSRSQRSSDMPCLDMADSEPDSGYLSSRSEDLGCTCGLKDESSGCYGDCRSNGEVSDTEPDCELMDLDVSEYGSQHGYDGFYDDNYPTWVPYVLRFLREIPRRDREWSSFFVCCDQQIIDIRREMVFAEGYKGDRDNMDWAAFFKDCNWHLASIKDPRLINFFSLIIVATCNVALFYGCPRETVDHTLRYVMIRQGWSTHEIDSSELDIILRGVVRGMALLFGMSKYLGDKAYEIPLYTNCLFFFAIMDSQCVDYIKHQLEIGEIPVPTGPCTLFQSGTLSVPSLVWELLNSGNDKNWGWSDISDAFTIDPFAFFEDDDTNTDPMYFVVHTST